MKKILITLALVLMASNALAEVGPDSFVVEASLVSETLDLGSNRLWEVYATCVDDGFTVIVTRLAEDGSDEVFSFTGVAGSATGIHAVANYILPIKGKFSKLSFVTDTGAADIDVHVYVN